MNADSFTVYIKTEDTYVCIAKDVESRFDTSNYESEKRLPEGKHKIVLGLIKD